MKPELNLQCNLCCLPNPGASLSQLCISSICSNKYHPYVPQWLMNVLLYSNPSCIQTNWSYGSPDSRVFQISEGRFQNGTQIYQTSPKNICKQHPNQSTLTAHTTEISRAMVTQDRLMSRKVQLRQKTDLLSGRPLNKFNIKTLLMRTHSEGRQREPPHKNYGNSCILFDISRTFLL